MNEKRIGAWNIDTRLDDIGADQNIRSAIIEIRHDVLKGCGRHLTMGDGEFDFRDKVAQAFGHLIQIRNTGTNIKSLATTELFAQNGLPHNHGIKRKNES